MPRQKDIGDRDHLPHPAYAPLVPPDTLSAAFASFSLWSTATSTRLELMETCEFPLEGDLSAFLVFNQLIYRGAARPTDLADALEISSSHMSKIIIRLEQAGLVLRAPARADNRAVEVGLTDQGRAAGHRITQASSRLFERIFQGWDEHDQSELVRLVVKWAHSLDKVSAHSLSRISGYHWDSPPR